MYLEFIICNCIPLRNTQYPPGTRSTCIGLGPPCYYVLLCWNATGYQLPADHMIQRQMTSISCVTHTFHESLTPETDTSSTAVCFFVAAVILGSSHSKTPHSLLCSDVGININIAAGLLESYPIIFISYLFFTFRFL